MIKHLPNQKKECDKETCDKTSDYLDPWNEFKDMKMKLYTLWLSSETNTERIKLFGGNLLKSKIGTHIFHYVNVTSLSLGPSNLWGGDPRTSFTLSILPNTIPIPTPFLVAVS